MPSLSDAIHRSMVSDRTKAAGIPTPEEEALQVPDWDPIDAAVAGMTAGGNLPARAMASGVDAASQAMMNNLPWWLAMPAAMALGHAAGRAMPNELVPGGERLAETGAIGPDVGKYVDVWHASPHKFDRFDSSHIGMGEGQQAFGHGLYFAESPLISGPGGQYEKAFSGPSLRFPNQDKASIYQVRLHADPNEFLNLDQRLSQDIIDRLPPELQSAIDERAMRSIWNDEGTSLIRTPANYSGRELLDALRSETAQTAMPETIGDLRAFDTHPDKYAAAYLESIGFPGTRYLDGLSRGAGEGTRNYVMFPGNDDRIEILKRYGLMLPFAGAGMAAQGVNDNEYQ